MNGELNGESEEEKEKSTKVPPAKRGRRRTGEAGKRMKFDEASKM